MKKNFKANMLRFLVLLPMAAFCLSGQSGADTGSNTGKYEGQTLCDAGDDVESSCTTHVGKNLSICGARKQNPYVMYMVYGTPEKIKVSSPREGEFPLRLASTGGEFPKEMGLIFYFTENGKEYLAYSVSDDHDSQNGMEGQGLIVRNVRDHRIIDHDFCVEDVKSKDEKDAEERIANYLIREHNYRKNRKVDQLFMNESLGTEMYSHLYPEE